MTRARPPFSALSMGCSSGGLNALSELLPQFPKQFSLPIIVVQHRLKDSDNFMVDFLGDLCDMVVKEAEDKELLCAGTIYIAPADYHLLVERDGSLSLDSDEEVCYSRPSIDVLFYSAADAFGEQLIGVVLTGGNNDGCDGIRYIKSRGGKTFAQDPQTAEMDIMPRAAIRSGAVDTIAPLQRLYDEISEVVVQ